MKVKTKILTPHRKGCPALKYVKDGRWNSPWAFFKPDSQYASADGRISRKGAYSYRWLLAGCNCTDCPAEIMVKEEDLLSSLPMGTKGK